MGSEFFRSLQDRYRSFWLKPRRLADYVAGRKERQIIQGHPVILAEAPTEEVMVLLRAPDGFVRIERLQDCIFRNLVPYAILIERSFCSADLPVWRIGNYAKLDDTDTDRPLYLVEKKGRIAICTTYADNRRALRLSAP